MSSHTYAAHTVWEGSTAVGYADYERDHRVALPPAEGELNLSSDKAFRGNPSRPNPESLLLAAASSCQLLSFLALAARARIDVVSYEDDAEAELPVTGGPMRMDGIVLRPHIVVAKGTDIALVERLVHEGHDQCYIANTLAVDVTVEPTITVAD